jgi:NAD(P)-dependent dehydrogenase (short-subunit alcohol dehydrogenase family)/acyl carrier protein
VGNALRQLIKWIANDELGPPPTTPYPIQAAREAFRFMQQAQHVGKIVITQNELSHRLSPNPRTHQLKGTYLVAGGWGALGIEVASWLAFRGAQHIILTGRSAPDKKAAEIIKMIRNIGIHITLAQADVADYAAMAKIFEQIQADPLPLRGVFHIAGVLDDGIIKSLTREQLARVMKVKIQGAWNLHLLTQNQNLDFFVLFSSVASVLGSPGQANYAAANAFLDSLAHYRSMREKDSLSINWGAWSGGGMATRAGTEQILMTQGVQPISPLNGMQIFQHLVIGDYTQAVVFPVDWQQATQSRVNFTPLLTEFINQKMTNVNQPLILDEIRTAPSGIQRTILASHVREMLAEILHLPSSSPIDDRDSFADLGIDSLMTVELRNMLQRSLDCTLPTTLFINYPTLEALLTYLLERINIAEPDQFSMEIPLNLETVSDNLDTLTEEELARQLDQKVEQLEKYTNDAS